MFQRIADNFHGFVDARSVERTIGEMPWVHRIQHTYSENSARILAGTRDLLAEAITRRRAAVERSQHLGPQVEALKGRVAELRGQMTGVVAGAPAVRNGERHLDAQAAISRQARELQARRAQAEAEVSAVQEQIVALQVEQARAKDLAARLEATIAEEFEMAVTIVTRMQEYYRRRLATYARRLARRGKLTGSYELTAPHWTRQPCPWLPDQTG